MFEEVNLKKSLIELLNSILYVCTLILFTKKISMYRKKFFFHNNWLGNKSSELCMYWNFQRRFIKLSKKIQDDLKKTDCIII